MRFRKTLLARGVTTALVFAAFCRAMSACSADELPGSPNGGTDGDADGGPRKDGSTPQPGVDGGPDGTTPPPTCGDTTCKGHGVCETTSSQITCKCDEGFASTDCSQKTADYGLRVKVANDVADPDVLKIDDDHYVMSGTGGTGLSLYESNDLVTWTKTKTYNPNDKDPSADYCFLWAPDLVKDAGKTWLYFSAYRGPKGETSCPKPAGSEYTTYRASADDGTLEFGKPEALFAGTTGARTYTSQSCPPEGCNRAIRIDPTLYDGRLYYVFFNGRNSIASVSMSNNNDIIVHNGLSAYNSYEENINEGPELFEHDGHKYLFFSAAFFNSQYATFYVMGNSPAELTRDRPIQRLTTPVRRGNGNLIETHGHNSITTRRGEAFNFFHMGVFDSGGTMIRRDTYRQRITWNPDGTAMNQNQVALSWNSLGAGYTYSLDLVLRDKSVVGPCTGAGIIKSQTSTNFLGVCPDASDRLVHRSGIAAFRLFASASGGAFKQVGEMAYDGYSDKLQMTVAP